MSKLPLHTNQLCKRYFILLFILNACISVNAQNNGIKYLKFTRHNFLASNRINCVIQDKKEFIWLATSNGIQRFDGNRWLWLGEEKGSATALPNNYVFSLMEDKQDRFWVHTSAGICLLNRNTFEFTPVVVQWLSKHTSKTIRSVIQLADGRVWLTLVSGGLYYFDEKLQQFISAEKIIPFEGLQVYQLAYDINTMQYFLGTDKGIVMYNLPRKMLSDPANNPSGNNLLKNPLATKRNVTLYLNKKSQLWFSSASTHACYDLTKEKIIFCDSISKTWGLMGYTTDASGITWGYGFAFTKMNLATGKAETIPQTPSEPYGISYENGNCLMEDKENTFWMATSSGLYVYNRMRQQFFNYPVKYKMNDGAEQPANVWGFLELDDSSVAAMTSSEQGLYYYDNNFNPLPPKYAIATAGKFLNIRCGIKAINNDIWLGGDVGYVLKINKQTKKAEKINDIAFSNLAVYCMKEDKNGNIWFGSFNKYILRRDAVTGMFSKINTLPPGAGGANIIYDLLPSDDQYIWAATSHSGLLKINRQTGIVEKRYSNNPSDKNSIPVSKIHDIISIDGNKLLLSSPAGIVIMDISKESFTLLNTSDRLPDNNVTSLLADKKNNIWFASDNGISKLQLNGRKVNSYGILEGLTNENFNLGNSIRLKDGRMLFGHSEGFVVFDPEKFSTETTPQNVSITGIKLFNNNLNADSVLNEKGGLVLDYRQNYLTIEFSNMSFLNRYHVEYSYQLEGVDKDWIPVSGKPEAVYNYLPGGSYTFKVKCKTKGGIESEEITSLKIRIIPPVWRQWWFYLLFAMLATGLVFLILRIRYRRKIEAEKVRTRIARDLHDDMGSTLSTINILSEMAKKKIDVDIPATKNFIHQISDNSNRIMESMDDIVWNIDTTNDSIENILSRMREFAGNLLEAKGIAYSFKEDGQIKQLNFELGRRHDFFMIFKEAVNNLAKYSEATEAKIEIAVKKNMLQLVIKDNGKGFEPALIKDGNGLINMQRRAAALNGNIDIASAFNEGTTISLKIPV